jgi:hypothetical protein
MLDVSPSNLYSEIQSAERFRDKHLEHYRDIISEYVGPAGPSGDRGESSPDNHVYEYLSLTIPRIVHDNPRVEARTRRPMSQGDAVSALEHGLNRWIRDTDIRSTLIRIAYDMLISFGATITTQEPSRAYDPQAKLRSYWPQCYRIPPSRLIIDPLALSFDQARYVGHMWVRDKEDLLEEAKDSNGWNVDVIERLAADAGTDNYYDQHRGRDVPSRNEVVCYDIWVPEVELDNSPGVEFGFHGTIYTITIGQTGGESDPGKVDFIRDPRPYYGPKTGPYTFYGAYYVPDSSYPLSPIMASLGQADELNSHVRSAARSAAQYKRLILVDSKSKKLMQDVKSQPDNFVVPVEGLDRDRVIPIELGGITNQQVSYIQMARERLDRNSGIHDVMRGNISGSATATEVATADASSSVRIDYIKRQFLRATEQMIMRVGWYLWNDDRVFFPLGASAAQGLEMGEPFFQGGGVEPNSYDDVELEVDAYSMERTNEALKQRRSLEALQVVSNVASAMQQAPYVNWEALLKQVGDSMNMPGMASLIDRQILEQMQQQAAMAQQAEIAAQQAETAGSVANEAGIGPENYSGAV